MKYVIRKALCPVDLAADWDSPSWQHAGKIKVDQFRQESSSHRPHVQAKVIYDHMGLYIQFRVADRYVIAKRHSHNTAICRDSCVEFFFQPFGEGGYFNFEQNCSGAKLCSYITDNTRRNGGFAAFSPLSEEELQMVRIFHTMPKIIEGEIEKPVQWRLAMHIPFKILEKYTGNISRTKLSGSNWRGNFFKCADDSSHPHWASWSPVPELNFHEPKAFGELVFE